MIKKIYLAFSIFIILSSISAQLSDLEQNIYDVFGVSGNEPVVQPTTAPTTFQIDDPKGSSCICVPYYQCDPDNNTILQDSSIDGIGLLDVRFNEDSCQVSIEKCCIEPREVNNPIQIVPHPERTASCGIRNDKGIDFQITGGSLGDSQYGEFPWTVAILNNADSSSLCAGSLIHPSVVLSAAHCLKKYRPLEMKIRAGEWDTQTDKERFPHQERAISRILNHPNFNDKTLANDIGLVFLAEPITIAENINPICLPSQDLKLDNTKDCFVTGWGKKNFGKTGRYSVIMKKVQMDTVPFDTCQAQLKKTRLGPKFTLHKTFVCAGGKKGVDACEGDGGAPLVCPIGNGKYQQAGIVAWGIGCGTENVPGVYGYVSKFRKWIDDSMVSAGYDSKSYTPA